MCRDEDVKCSKEPKAKKKEEKKGKNLGGGRDLYSHAKLFLFFFFPQHEQVLSKFEQV